MTDFTPTHRITLASGEEILVSSDGAGPAYTREEWTSGTAADYERLSDGTWTCQGKAFAGEVTKIIDQMTRELSRSGAMPSLGHTTPIAIRRPAELSRREDGTYSVHYYGEESGVVLDWDGRSAADLLAEDEQEVMGAGAVGDDGTIARLEVMVIQVGSDGECTLIDSASL